MLSHIRLTIPYLSLHCSALLCAALLQVCREAVVRVAHERAHALERGTAVGSSYRSDAGSAGKDNR